MVSVFLDAMFSKHIGLIFIGTSGQLPRSCTISTSVFSCAYLFIAINTHRTSRMKTIAIITVSTLSTIALSQLWLMY